MQALFTVFEKIFYTFYNFNRFEADFLFRNMNGENLAGNIAIAEWRGVAEDLFDEVAHYRAVTAQQVREIASRLFRKGNSSVLYYLKR